MEKKAYINPTMDVVRLHTMQMMASSPNAEFNPSEEATGMEGRGGDLDDDF